MNANLFIVTALCLISFGCSSDLTKKEAQISSVLLVDNSSKISSSTKKLNKEGFVSYRSGEFIQALDYFSEAIETNSKYSEAYVNRAHVYSKLKRFDKALLDYERAIEIDRNARAYSGRGLVYWELGKVDKAIADLNQAVRLAPQNPSVYVSRGSFYAGFNNLEQAFADFDRAIELNPQYANAYNNRGYIYEALKNDFNRLGSREKALADYNHAIELDPLLSTAYLNRGILLADT